MSAGRRGGVVRADNRNHANNTNQGDLDRNHGRATMFESKFMQRPVVGDQCGMKFLGIGQQKAVANSF